MHRLVLIFASLLPVAASADVRTELQRFTSGLQSLHGRFEQQVVDANGQPGERSAGEIALKAPRQFRWEYQQPYSQLIVADSDHIWLYDPDLEQVTVRVQSYEEQTSPLAALIDPGELERQFIVGDGGVRDGIQWITLKARKPEDSAVQSATLGLRAGQLVQMTFDDQLGQRTEVHFSGWVRNGALPAAHFRFTPPPGVDVVGETRDSADVQPLRDP